MESRPQTPPGGPTLGELARYFIRLGGLGFGGPVALANAMRRDLVEGRGWLTSAEYEDGLAIAAACPGPLAYQLGVYCGYVRQGVRGGLCVAVAFALVPFVLVVLAAVAYTRFEAARGLRAIFYGVAPVVVAFILKAGLTLGRKTLRRDAAAWALSAAACIVTLVMQRELAGLFVLAGSIGLLIFAPPASGTDQPPTPEVGPPTKKSPARILAATTAGLASSSIQAKLFLFFFKTGLLVFGSGLVIVPFLKTYVVDQYHWLGNREFLDAVAIGMVSPGPVVITATFVGFLLGGLSGALCATVGMFLPAVLFTIVATPVLLRYRANRRLQGFVRGVTVAVVGVLVGTTGLVAQSAIGDWLTALIAASALLVLYLRKDVPEPLLVGVGAVVGLIASSWFAPAWMLR